MPIVSGVIVIGTPWLQSRTRGVVIAETVARSFPRYAPVPPAGPPITPKAETGTAEKTIKLTWFNGAESPCLTEIWVSNDGVSGWALLDTVPLAQTAYVHNTGLFGALRYYRFRHVNVTDNSVYSWVVSATSQVDFPDAPPTGLILLVATTRPVGENTVTLSWTNGDATAATEVWGRQVGGTFGLFSTVVAGQNSFLAAGLTPNTSYEAYVRHTKSGVPSTPSNIAAGTTLVDGPDADPTSLVATGGTGVAGQGNNYLTWTNGDGSAQTNVYASLTSGGALTLLGSVPQGASAFTHAVGAFAALRYYKVRHVKNSVFSVGYSNEASAVSGQDIPDAPPTSLSATVPARPSGETQLALSWTNGDPSAQTVVRVQQQGFAYATAATVAAGASSLLLTGLLPNTAYSVFVYHTKNAVDSASSNVAQATTLVDGPDAPPTALAASNPGAGQVPLTWTNGDTTAATEVYRTQGSTTSLIATVGAGTASYLDTPGGGLLLTYKVRHLKNGVASDYSNAVSLTTLPAPAAPTLNSVTATPGQFTLSWANADSSAQVAVFASANGVSFTEVAVLAAGTVAWVDAGGYAEMTLRYFKVAARKNGFDSFSGVRSATTPDVPNAPPVSLAGVNNGAGNVTLSWTNGDTTAATEVLRDGTVIATVAAGTAIYAYNQGAGVTRSYVVRHTKSGYPSANSNTASVTTGAQPAGAPVLASVVGGSGRLDLTWSNADTYSQVEVYVSVNGGGYTLFATLAAGSTTTAYTGLPKNTLGAFYVRHKNDGYFSVASATRSAYTYNPPVAVSGLVTQNVAWNYGEARWTVNDTGSDTSMTLYYRVQGAATWTAVQSRTLGSVAVGAIFNVALPVLMPQTSYQVFVQMYRRDAGGRDWYVDSAVVSLTTPQLPAPYSGSRYYLGADNNYRGGDYSLSWSAGVSGAVTEWAMTTASDVWLANGEFPAGAAQGEVDSNIPPNTYVMGYLRHRYVWQGVTVYSAWTLVFTETTPGDNISGTNLGGGTVNNVSFERYDSDTLWFKWDEAGNPQVDNNAYDWEVYYPSGALHSSGYVSRDTGGLPWWAFVEETQFGTWVGRVRWRVNGYTGPWQSASFNNGTPVPSLQVYDVSTCSGGTPVYTSRITWGRADVETEVQMYNASSGVWWSLNPTEPKGANNLYHVGITEEPNHYLVGAGQATYRARHLKNGVYSDWSASASANIAVLACSSPPSAAPSNLSGGNTSGCSGTTAVYSVSLTWTNGDGSAQTNVYRGSTLVATVAAGATSYLDTLASTGTFTYTVKHLKSGTESVGSNTYTVSVGSVSCSGGGGGGCFPAGTPVTMADGTQRSIEQVQVGDRVLAFTDEDSLVACAVRATLRHAPEETPWAVTLYLRDGTVVQTTPEHPFYVGGGEFVRADSLNEGDEVFVLKNGGLVPEVLERVTDEYLPTETFNLDVESLHTYFANGVAVHNIKVIQAQ